MKIELSLENPDILATWHAVGKHECGNPEKYCPLQSLDGQTARSTCKLTGQTGPRGFSLSPSPACPLHKALTQLDTIFADYTEDTKN